MAEISDKLARELLERIARLEKLCDENSKKGRPAKYDVDTDWMTAGCLCHDLRVHLQWHVRKDVDPDTSEMRLHLDRAPHP